MVGVGCKRFLKLFIIFKVLMPVTFAFAAIEFSTENTIYRASSCGIVFLASPYSATSFTFSDGFLMFSGFNYGSGTWGTIGFSCETEIANMTVNIVQNSYLKYTVDAPTSTTSITKVYLGSKGSPTSVVGADSWEYSSVNKTLTVSNLHSSPQEIEFEWENVINEEADEIYSSLMEAYGIAALIPLLLVCVAIVGALNGNIDQAVMGVILKMCLLMILTMVILARLSSYI